MKFKNAEHEELSLNLAPLIDVVFLLLIFFMVTASFSQNSAMDLTLPKASGSQKPPEGLFINVTINKLDEISIENQLAQTIGTNNTATRKALSDLLGLAIVQARLKDPSKADEAPTINIEADESASHGKVVQLMEAIGELGIDKIQFAVDPTSSQDEK